MAELCLVTGSTGFIGSALCRALSARADRVRALHRPNSPLAALEGLPVERVVGNVLQPETLVSAMGGVKVVFHAAAQSAYWRFPRQVVQVIVDGTRNVVRAAAASGVQRVVLTSSLAAMGVPDAGELLSEEHVFNLPPGRFPYGYAKRQAEVEALREAGDRVEVVVVNPSVVLGPGDRNRISGSLVTEAARGRTFFWVDGGINLVHVQDVVTGHLAAAAMGRPGERYILGGENLTHRQVFTLLAKVVGRRPPRLKLPTGLLSPGAWVLDLLGHLVRLPLNGDQLRMSRHYLYCDTSKARRELRLPDPLPIRQAAEEAWLWYREQGML